MKKGTVIIITLLLVFTGCALDQGHKSNEELLRYTNESGKISSIHSQEKIDIIKNAFGHTKWNQKKFNNQSGYYSVWIEKDEKKQRKENYRIWIDADSNDITKDVAKIFNPKNGEYGYLNSKYTEKIKSILNW
ncbi:MAG: hypothetical protein ABF629_01885 [Sporolactobacillus sp.]